VPTSGGVTAVAGSSERAAVAMDGQGAGVGMDVDGGEEELYAMAAAQALSVGVEPRNEREARTSADWPQWEAAMEKELHQLTEAETWVLVDWPEGRNIIGSRWVYRLKRDAAGAIVKYKV